MKYYILIALFLVPGFTFAQSDFDKALKAGELLLGGFSIFKVATSNPKADSKFIESICVKNKLTEKITIKITGKDEQDNEVKKELVVQNDGKECLFNVPKGVYTYEVSLSNKDIYKKGEYKFEDEVVITIKKDD
jgi:hypothetical protein